MDVTFRTIFIFFLLLSTGCGADRIEPSGIVVLHDVHVLTMNDEAVTENQTVIIQDGIITWTGDSSEAEIPADATVIRGDVYVMPGLAEMHAHIPSPNQGRETMENTLALYLSHGITTIRGMLGDPEHLILRERAQDAGFFSPRILTSGPSFNGNTATEPETTRQMVRDQAAAGYDLLKLHPGITLENFEALADEANTAGIEFSGHISARVGLIRSLKAGQGTIDHIDRYMEFLAGVAPEERDDPSIIYFGYDLTPQADRDKIEKAAELTREAGTWVVPTNTLLENVFNPELTTDVMRNWPGMEYMAESTVTGWVNYVENFRSSDDYNPDQAREFLEIRKALTLSFHEHGAGILLGADAPQIFNPPGFSTHRELELLVKSGLTPFEAIKTGTVNVGVYLNQEDRVGKIAPGYNADLILLSENPLENIPFHDKIEGLVYRGKYVDRSDLDSKLDALYP